MSAAFDSSTDLAPLPLIRRAATNADCAEVAALDISPATIRREQRKAQRRQMPAAQAKSPPPAW